MLGNVRIDLTITPAPTSFDGGLRGAIDPRLDVPDGASVPCTSVP